MCYKRISTVSTISILFLSLIHFTQAQTWTQLTWSGTTPSARYGHTAVYDNTNNLMTIFGGFDTTNDARNDVWVFSHANGLDSTISAWIQFSPTPDPTQTTNGFGGFPAPRTLHTAVYDNANNLMTIFGGVDTTVDARNDVWVLSHANGLGETPVWTKLTPTGSAPPVRFWHTAVYDTTNNRMTIFGGLAGSDSNDIWVLSHANGLGGTSAWTQLTPTGSAPTTRDSHSAVYDSINNRMIIFGGWNDSEENSLNDVWVLSNANGLGGTPAWTQLTPTGSTPPTRCNHTAVYNNTNNQMTIFGGWTVSSALNDTWVLSHANGLGGTPAWTHISPTGSAPTTRYSHTAIYDNTNNRMTIFGGDGSTGCLNDVWVLNNINIKITSVPKGIWELLDK